MTRYYQSFDQDFTQAQNQNYTIDNSYDFMKEKPLQRLFSFLIYPPFVLFGWIYTRFILKIRLIGKEKLKGCTPCFIFSNHTQPVGDAFLIPRAVFPKRVNVMISPANMSIPVIGRLLPYLGGMPLPGTVKGLIRFNSAFEKKGSRRISVIFPEAHVWEYCEEIRPFKASAFLYAAKANQPVFSLTVTYQKSRFKKPKATAYIDGPFYADPSLTPKKSGEKLSLEIRGAMLERAENSNAGYIVYKPEPNE